MDAPFCRLPTDTNCFIPLILHAGETLSHGLRQFLEPQILYVVEFSMPSRLASCEKDWHSPCTIPQEREIETRNAFGGARREEGLMK
jgi:hypothetical protein